MLKNTKRMILKKISLNNIRSYEHQEVDFRGGSVLLSGDIGSGKTSVLLAIEFALFGLQPGQKGSSLLRNGANNGGVSIEFEVSGKNIFVERTLKKGKTISQDYSAITIDGEKQEISVTELKSKVLELINYPKEFSKKQNLLYKFTVYTPQEEMKQIIIQDSETRINTLRHIFGIDKYKKIIENVSVLSSKIKEEKKMKEGIILNLDQEKREILLKESELKSKYEYLSSIESELLIKINEKEKSQKELEDVSKQKEEKTRLEQEIEKIKIIVSVKNSSIQDNGRVLEQLKLQIYELEKSSFDPLKIQQMEKEITNLKSKKKILEDGILEVSTRIVSLNLKNQENEKIKEKLSHIEVCPTCLQDVNPTYKSNVLKKIYFSNSENAGQINELSLQKTKFLEEKKYIENEICLQEKLIQYFNILKVKLEGILEKKQRIQEIEKLTNNINNDLKLLENQIVLLKSEILNLKKFEIIHEEKQKNLNEALRQEKLTEIKMAELKKEISLFSKQINELKEKVKESEKIHMQFSYLSDLENWLSNHFVPVISSVERNVMDKLKSEFSKLFSEWFSMLVSDNFNVRLDDNFTPVIEFQDYEIEYDYLSGGERTAIALAYRLALNQVINSKLSNIKTKGFIILDEPTDGFSSQQLDKMRLVLEQLNAKQLVIVSHDQKMEDFVDNIIKFKKQNGRSYIEI